MSKVYSFHMISLKAGASAPDFEQYFQKELKSWPIAERNVHAAAQR